MDQIDSRITLQNLTATVPIQTPNDWRRESATTRNTEATARHNELIVADQEDARRQTDLVRRVAQETNGDWEQMIPRLRAVAPAVALKFEEDLIKQRKEKSLAASAELEQDAKLTEWGLGLLRTARDPETYRVIRQQVVQQMPDMDPILPPEFDPAVIQHVQTKGEQSKDVIARQQKSLELLADGKWNVAAGMALSAAADEQEWTETLDGLSAMGVPRAVLRTFGAWSPEAGAKAMALAMTPDQRVDNARLDAGQALDLEQFGETRRHNRVSEGIAAQNARSNAVRAAKSGSESSGGAEDAMISAFADAYMAGHTDIVMGKTPTIAGKIEGEVLRRGGQLAQRRVKLPAAMTQKVMDAEQGLNTLDLLESLVPKVSIGPIAGRVTRWGKVVPGAPVSKDTATFLAETAKLTNRTITAITGAAMGEAEAQRIMAELPQVTDKLEVWKANAASTRRNLEYLAQRALELNGATPEMVEQYRAERKPDVAPMAAPAVAPRAPAAPASAGGNPFRKK